MEKLLDMHPSVQELKKIFFSNNENVMYEQKMKILQKGAFFPKISKDKVSFKKYIQ